MQGSPTGGTGILPDPQGPLLPVAAHRAVLARILGVYPHHPPTSLFRFVGEDREKLCPARIQHPLGGVASGQAENIQILVNNDAISVDQPLATLWWKSLRWLAILR